MSPGLLFQQLFRDVLARQVEYSYCETEDSVTTMVPLKSDRLSRVFELANAIEFAGDWAWSVERFANAARPEDFLFRVDWLRDEPTAVTLYCRFPVEPDAGGFQRAIGFSRPFTWNGPDPVAVARALSVPGPRGIAFRATRKGNLRTAVYFRTEHHAGASWGERLAALLAACQYPPELASTIESDLKELYQPGPVGVIGVDDGQGGIPGALKFDPASVPSEVALTFLARMGLPAARINALRDVAIGLRAESVTYAGVQYGSNGFSGWRLYFACEPGFARRPGAAAIESARNLRPVRRLPHH